MFFPYIMPFFLLHAYYQFSLFLKTTVQFVLCFVSFEEVTKPGTMLRGGFFCRLASGFWEGICFLVSLQYVLTFFVQLVQYVLTFFVQFVQYVLTFFVQFVQI